MGNAMTIACLLIKPAHLMQLPLLIILWGGGGGTRTVSNHSLKFRVHMVIESKKIYLNVLQSTLAM